jgi:hypothetical protein
VSLIWGLEDKSYALLEGFVLNKGAFRTHYSATYIRKNLCTFKVKKDNGCLDFLDSQSTFRSAFLIAEKKKVVGPLSKGGIVSWVSIIYVPLSTGM